MQSALFIGRFQPFHKGHLDVIKKILQENEHVIIAIGSAEQNFMRENPLTASERFQLIEAAMRAEKIPAESYSIIPVPNINNYAIWVNHVNTYVPPYTRLYTGSEIVKACYEGKYNRPHEKTKCGPQILQLKRKLKISASMVREKMLKRKNWEELVPPAVAALIKKWGIIDRIKTIHSTMDKMKIG